MNNPQQSNLTHQCLRRLICAPWLLPLLLLALPTAVQAQFNYTPNGNGTCTITQYTGPGGAVIIPDVVNGYAVSAIGACAFDQCTTLRSLSIGTNVSSIGAYAFSGCTNLTGVTIPDSVTSLGDGAFETCSGLTHVTIGSGVTRIGYLEFCGCTSLTGVTIPNSVTNIGISAFVGCTSLTSVTIGNGVTSIGDFAFQECTRLTNVTIGSGVISIGDYAFDGCTSLTSVTIPNSVASIGERTFEGCSSLGSATIGNSVTNIGIYAFQYCYRLTRITIPNSVINIGSCAFYRCTSLTTVSIASSVSSIGVQAFSDCDLLTGAYFLGNAPSADSTVFLNNYHTTVYYLPGATGWGPTFGGRPTALWIQFNYTINGDSTITLTEYTGSGGDVVIPGTINGLPVTGIGSNTFWFCTNLTSVTIPGSVSSIGDSAFSSCASLTNVMISTGVTSIGNSAFSSCTSLTNVMIPTGVTSIGASAFYYCTNLTGITVPNSVTSIGEGAFSACTSLASCTIPNSVTSIAVQAFVWCSGLTNVTIPGNVTSIGLQAFCFCSGLSNLTIPASVTNIGATAFSGCTKLAGIYFLGNAPNLGGIDVFTGDSNLIVYYLRGTTGWGTTFGGIHTAPWLQVPIILVAPRTQTAELGSVTSLRVLASSPLPLFYLWYLNDTNLISCSTNSGLEVIGVQFDQSGAYTVVISNVLGAITSAPALLNVIAPVERRPVPGVNATGAAGSLLNVDYADSLSPAPTWTPLGFVNLTGTPQYCFDLTLPLPAQRFYRAWQTGTPGARPSLELHMVPAITLTGSIGGSVRVDAINQFGPTDAWFTLDTVTLTNASQLYFDTSAWRQPPRLYRRVQVP